MALVDQVLTALVALASATATGTKHQPDVNSVNTSCLPDAHHDSDFSSPIGSSEGKTTLFDDTYDEISDDEANLEDEKVVSGAAVKTSSTSDSVESCYIRRFVKKNDPEPSNQVRNAGFLGELHDMLKHRVC